jgi:lipopolysaccharide transport system ATP-binding protein
MKPAISVHNLSKQYRIGKKPSRDNNLTENIRRQVRTAWDKVSRLVKPNKEFEKDESFWALKDVSFEVQPGEVVGIIGRNGAGKSTLLKILSQIVEPTSGHADIRGRMGSLLEVGTGFHPELTGRENIYLNGAILGMKREEITKKFDEIVAFAEVEKFLDTPVKRYSSGMYVRLAFAVAAHLEPEILIVDEVLAVGDQAFQKKCLGKMNEVQRSGRTIIVVSHNTAMLRTLCSTCVILNKGQLEDIGSTDKVLNQYLSDPLRIHEKSYELESAKRSPDKTIILKEASLQKSTGEESAVFECGEQLNIVLTLRLPFTLMEPQVGIGIDDVYGQRITSVGTFLSQSVLPSMEGVTKIRCAIDKLPLAQGEYFLSLSVGNLQNPLMDQVEHLVHFTVEPGDFYGNGRYPINGLGQILLKSTWTVSGNNFA